MAYSDEGGPPRPLTEWRDETVLVTGGAGFLGSHLCRRLLLAGAVVHATSRRPQIPGPGRGCWWQSNLSSLDEVRSLVRRTKPTIIYHLAGSVGAKPDIQYVLPTFESLLSSTIYILIAAAEIGCRRVVLSGSLTEPNLDTVLPIPSSPYAAAKWAASAYGRMFHVLYRTPVVSAVPFMTFGPHQDEKKLIPSVILSFLRGEAPELTSGRWEADWVYVDDVVDGLLAAGVVPGIEGNTLDLGSGRTRAVREVVETIATIMASAPQPNFGALPDRPSEPVRIANVQETRRRIGWSPQTVFEEGLRRTVLWYRQRAPEKRS